MDPARHLPWTGFRLDITSVPPPFPLAIVIPSPCMYLLVLDLCPIFPFSRRPREDPPKLLEWFLQLLATFWWVGPCPHQPNLSEFALLRCNIVALDHLEPPTSHKMTVGPLRLFVLLIIVHPRPPDLFVVSP